MKGEGGGGGGVDVCTFHLMDLTLFFLHLQVCRQRHGAGLTDGAEMVFPVQLLAGHRH